MRTGKLNDVIRCQIGGTTVVVVNLLLELTDVYSMWTEIIYN